MTMPPETFEGRLTAQRQILARLIHAHGGGDLRDFMRDRSTVRVPEEDPGADGPDSAFGIEAALAEEMRLILDAVERLD
ncbi:hypothetical protein [Loktanella sp. SALINAS62]|uniref:hypothetical protein n=1 Tax=Loktanella sp. SALINAS62 TaxID=2706124 RepID=UPI001B8C5FF4|nr:hypothetical protein [Loktanella sp. SALINAS62]MBS1301254.1 hypothetical protein [Loktanella sp. SALINAS62]